MSDPVSIAIETSCRCGSVALGRGDTLRHFACFDASARHATALLAHLDALLADESLTPAEVGEIYVSAGPGSFTGIRVGVTVARTMMLAVPKLRCVSVPTAEAVAVNAAPCEGENLAVVMDARNGFVYVTCFRRRQGRWAVRGRPKRLESERFLAEAPRPLVLMGEGLGYHDLAGEGLTPLADPIDKIHLPTAQGVWHVGRERARAGQFTAADELLPIYTGRPEAVRLWEARHGPAG